MNNIAGRIAHRLLNGAGKKDSPLSAWEQQSSRNAAFLRGLETYWRHPEQEEAAADLPQVRQRLLVRLGSEEKKKRRASVFVYCYKAAAVAALLVAVSGLSVYLAKEAGFFHPSAQMMVSTEAGQQSKLSLPDGSLVWLNAETQLVYTAERDSRRISLTGEAYFEVKHAQDRPFIVETENVSIHVTGTKFNVSHYAQTAITETSLLEGSVYLSIPGKTGESGERLFPGEKAVYDARLRTFSKRSTHAAREILWKNGILVFENEPFDGLIKKLERHYAVKIIYEAERYKDKHYTGTIDNLSVKKVLDFINLTIPLRYEIDNKTIYFDRAGNKQ
ncbi:MAG: FecR domain-containing protein [Tannerellaceae bacterium]|nr:FecR domain-containing protein [Tannerellaceae bacterium]